VGKHELVAAFSERGFMPRQGEGSLWLSR